MKNVFKRTLAILLTVVMLIGIAPMGAIDLSVKSSAMDLSSYKVGDIIEFGSYPQSKVVDNELIEILETVEAEYPWISYNYYIGTGNLYYGNTSSSDYMLYKDFAYNDTKYRAVTFSSYRPNSTDKISLSEYSNQDENYYYVDFTYYFKYEPLTWRVLDPSSGFVMCCNVIDAQAYQNNFYFNDDIYYNSENCSTYVSDWATSSLRQWLNNDFYNTAFSEAEKAMIEKSYVENKSTYSSIYDSKKTYDSMFLLSSDDIANSEYGFNSSFQATTSRQLKSTDYAQCQGCVTNRKTSDCFGNSWWWLRTPCDSFLVDVVSYTGEFHDGDFANETVNGVVPAFKFKLNTGTHLHTWSNWMIDTGKVVCDGKRIRYCTECGETEIRNFEEGTIIEYGSYPQSEVVDRELIEILETIEDEYPWISYDYYSGTGSRSDGNMLPSDYMRYKDFYYNGTKYRAVLFTEYRPRYTGYTCSSDNSFQYRNGYYLGQTYYFRYEPLTWRILSPTEGYVMCNKVIDSQAYQNYIYLKFNDYYNCRDCSNYASDWETSSIRYWLNNDFYNVAFSNEEKVLIESSNLFNSSFFDNKYSGKSTNDKIFLLSSLTPTNSSYGFNSSETANDCAKWLRSTDYSKCQGNEIIRSGKLRNCSSWWLRNPFDSISTKVVTDVGRIDYGFCVEDTSMGVVPAFKFNIKSQVHIHTWSNWEMMDSNIYTGKKTRICSKCGAVESRDYMVGDSLSFGSYPQSRVLFDEDLYDKFEEASKSVEWSSYNYYIGTGNTYDGEIYTSDYMQYKDFYYNGDKYRAVQFSQYRPYRTCSVSNYYNSIQDDNGYYLGTIYYFKYEPLKWIVLDPDEGFVVCDKVIDSQEYQSFMYRNGKEYYNDNNFSTFASDWATSTLRKWLNNDFYNSAFTYDEKKKIGLSHLTNSNPWDDTISYSETDDYIYLLSYYDAINKEYGMNCQLKSTDYAQCQGCEKYKDAGYAENAWWWLRSPSKSGRVADVNFYGEPGTTAKEVSYTSVGIVPALRFNTLYTICDNHNYIPVDTNPTCTEQGYTTYTCECGDNYVDNYVDALGHDFGEWKVTTPATCTSTGVETRYCSRCDATETRDVEKISHNYTAVVTNPTCTEQGYTTYTCSCGDSYVDDYVNALGHDFGEWEVTTPATCTSKGVETRYCSRCDAKETRDIEKISHSYTLVVINPTCTEQGYTNYTCSCGDSYVDDYVDALGHDYKAVVTAPTCTEQGFTTYTCSRCMDSYIADYTPAKGHTDGEWKVTKQPTLTEEGEKTLYCKECGQVIKTEAIPKLTHGQVHSISVNDISLNYKSSKTLVPTVEVDEGVNYTVTYSSSNPKVATVDENGKVTATKKGSGSATITCTVTDEYGNIVTDTCTVKVSLNFGQILLVYVLFGWIWY